MQIIAQALLPEALLSVAACAADESRYLDVTSLLNRDQQLLLPLSPHEPLVGIAMTTVISGWTSVAWALAWGDGTVGPETRIRFSSDGLRHRATREALPQQLTSECWVAEASGVFALATLSVHDVDVATTTLSRDW